MAAQVLAPEHPCADLTGRAYGECFWLISTDRAIQWPRVLIPRCEMQFVVSLVVVSVSPATAAVPAVNTQL